MNQIVSWLLAHFNYIAWPAVVVASWRVSSVLKGYKDRFGANEATINATKETIEKIATNHLPHMQAELEKINTALDTGFDRLADRLGDLYTVMSNK